jgi:uncharacterized membrane protein
MVVALAILLPLALVFDGLPRGDGAGRAVAFAALSGVCEFLGLGALLKGLATGNLSVVTPLASLSGGFAAGAVILMGEPLPALAMVGLPLAVVGGMMASVERRPVLAAAPAVAGAAAGGGVGATGGVAGAGPGPAPVVAGAKARAGVTAGAGWALLSAALFAGTLLFLSEASTLPPLTLAAVGRVSTIVLAVPVAALTGGFALAPVFRRRVAGAGVADAASFVAIAAAIIIGPVSVASVAMAQSGMMAAVLGLVLLHERLGRVQLAGVAVTCVAITLLASSGLG